MTALDKPVEPLRQEIIANNTTQSEGLKRELGVLDVTTNVINITIGSGIFLMPAIIAGILGSASILAYIICGCMYLLVALCFAEASSRVTTSGGAYAYIEKAFGHYFGTIANALLAVSGILLGAALMNGIADMLSVSFPVFEHIFFRDLLFAICFSLFAYSNIIGVKQGMRVAKATTLLKVLPLFLLVVVGLFKLNTSNLHWQGFPPGDKLGSACLLLFFAFFGGETALNISGEMKNPKRTAPLGLLLGVTSVIVFYSLIQVVSQSTLGPELISQKAPLAAVAGKLTGNWGIKILLIGGLISIIGTLYSIVLVIPRVLFAGANDGLLPKFLSKVHPKYATPYLAIISFALLAFLLAISGGFRQLIILATISMLLLYVGVALALIKFRISKRNKFPASFMLPGGILVPVLTLLVLAWLLSHSKSNEIEAAGIFIAFVSFIYFIKILFQKRKAIASVADTA
ncbi:MAG TPA: amino acid permease [Ginsengibacter sp.]